MILKGGIEDTLWPEIVPAMIYIKNFQPTRVLEEFISPMKKQDDTLSSVQHLRILGSNIYIFFQEKKHTLKLAKWANRTLKKKLVGFDSHTIYRIHVKK